MRVLGVAAVLVGLLQTGLRADEVEPTMPDLDAEPVAVDVTIDWDVEAGRIPAGMLGNIPWMGWTVADSERLVRIALPIGNSASFSLNEGLDIFEKQLAEARDAKTRGILIWTIDNSPSSRQWKNEGAVLLASAIRMAIKEAVPEVYHPIRVVEERGIRVKRVRTWLDDMIDLMRQSLLGTVVASSSSVPEVELIATVSPDGDRSILFIIKHPGRVALPSVNTLFGVDDEDELHYAGIDHKGLCGCEPDDATSRIVRPGYSLYLISTKPPEAQAE